MKIKFETKEALSLERLILLANTPDIGFDDWSGCCPTFFYIEEGIGYHLMGGTNYSSSEALERAQKGPVWVTAFSRFAYQQQTAEGGKIWCYSGAGNGYLQQNLLPPELAESTIISVSGTYGEILGANALDDYNAIKRAWTKTVVPVIEVFHRSANLDDADRTGWWDRGEVAAALWNVLSPKEKGDFIERIKHQTGAGDR